MNVRDKFWCKLRVSMGKKSKNGWEFSEFRGDECVNWQGCVDRDGYGTKRITWPNGSCSLERTHRLSFMLHHKLLRNEIPRLNDAGLELDVSHLCHNKACINPLHLVLEPHSVNVSRTYCVVRGSCCGEHNPACLFLRTN